MTPRDDLLVERECRRLIDAFARLVDAREDEAAAALFAADGRLVRGADSFEGPDGVLRMLRSRPLDLVTCHLNAGTLVEPAGPGAATAATAFLVLRGTRPPAGGPVDLQGAQRVAGRYRDRFALTPAGWRFAERAVLIDFTG